jgi:UDP-N-acetylglucosamine transferase subunit ALG13
MIFVVLGTCPFQFYRLIKAIDEYAKEYNKDNFFIQIGYTDYLPKHCEYKRFLSRKKYNDILKETDFLIAHAGIGVVLDAAKYKKKLIVAARMPELREHSDNHQVQLERILISQNRAIKLDLDRGVEGVKAAISLAGNFNFVFQNPSRDVMLKKISDYIENFRKNKLKR